jgi:CRP-like cAMP-binding protein
MISPEVLRRYPFFSFMTHDQLREVAMITEEVEVEADTTLFESGGVADALCLLERGSIELHFVVYDELKTGVRKNFLVGTINPGEIFSISALIMPYELTSTVVATVPSTFLKIDAAALRALAEEDKALGCGLQQQAARAAMERLQATRIQLAAAGA